MDGIGGGFFERMKKYYLDKDYASLEKQILKAAHYHASNWEFKIIYPMNPQTFGIEQVKTEMAQGRLAILFTASDILPEVSIFKSFVAYRKAEIPTKVGKAVRMPETLLWGICLSLRFCRTLCRLNLTILAENVLKTTSFGTFHDLPEVLTRDIVSPVRTASRVWTA